MKLMHGWLQLSSGFSHDSQPRGQTWDMPVRDEKMKRVRGTPVERLLSSVERLFSSVVPAWFQTPKKLLLKVGSFREVLDVKHKMCQMLLELAKPGYLHAHIVEYAF